MVLGNVEKGIRKYAPFLQTLVVSADWYNVGNGECVERSHFAAPNAVLPLSSHRPGMRVKMAPKSFSR